MIEDTKRVNSLLGLSLEGSSRLRKAKEDELRLVWDLEKVEMGKKVDAMDIKQNPFKKSHISAKYRDILIRDKERNNKYGYNGRNDFLICISK